MVITSPARMLCRRRQAGSDDVSLLIRGLVLRQFLPDEALPFSPCQPTEQFVERQALGCRERTEFVTDRFRHPNRRGGRPIWHTD